MMVDHALAAARRGFRVFPCQPLTKDPMRGFRWKRDATQDEATIRALWADTPDANIGAVADDMIIVDEDNKNNKPGALEFEMLGINDATYTVATPNDGLHHYYAYAGLVSQRAIGQGLDVRASGKGYVIAPGSKLPNGEYVVAKDLPLLPAPPELVAICGQPRDPAKDPRVAVAELDTEANVQRVIEYLLHFAPPATEGERGDDQTYLVACRAKDLGVSEPVALDLMLEHYNDRCSPPWECEELELKVASAYAHGQNPPGSDTPEYHFAGVEIPEPEYRPRLRGKAIRAGDDIDFDQEWLLFERLPQVGTAMVVAPSGAGKTFLAYELARCLATGDKFFGTEPDDKCGAVILAGEGLAGVPARMKTLGKLPISTVPTGQLGDKANVKALVADIEAERDWMKEKHGVRLGLIVIDTLTAVGLLQDENNNSECGAAVKALEALALRFNCMVLVNHHPPKNGTGARGGGALHAGFDVVLEVAHEKGQEVRYVECTKAREGRVGAWGSFTLISITVGFDRRGRARTTCEVSMGSEPRVITGKQPPKFDAFEASIETARVIDDVPKGQPVKRASVQTAFGELAHISDRGNRSKAFNKCLDFAAAAGRVRVVRGANDEQFINDVKEENQ